MTMQVRPRPTQTALPIRSRAHDVSLLIHDLRSRTAIQRHTSTQSGSFGQCRGRCFVDNVLITSAPWLSHGAVLSFSHRHHVRDGAWSITRSSYRRHGRVLRR
jgi:hypothetical protein